MLFFSYLDNITQPSLLTGEQIQCNEMGFVNGT